MIRGSTYSVLVEDECHLADICGVLIGHRVVFTVEPGEGRTFLVSLLPEGAELVTEMYGPKRSPVQAPQTTKERHGEEALEVRIPPLDQERVLRHSRV